MFQFCKENISSVFSCTTSHHIGVVGGCLGFARWFPACSGGLLIGPDEPTYSLYDILWVLFLHFLSEVSYKHEKCLIVRIKVSSNLNTFSNYNWKLPHYLFYLIQTRLHMTFCVTSHLSFTHVKIHNTAHLGCDLLTFIYLHLSQARTWPSHKRKYNSWLVYS